MSPFLAKKKANSNFLEKALFSTFLSSLCGFLFETVFYKELILYAQIPII